MMETVGQIRDRLRAEGQRLQDSRRDPEPVTPVITEPPGRPVVLIHNPDKLRSFIASPFAVVESAAGGKAANPDFLQISGRYVEAGRPNRNLAYWSTPDLQMGLPTVAGGPLNWL